MDYKKFLEQGDDNFLQNLSIDLVIVGYQDGKLKSLLLQFGDKWLLPGGYIHKNESVNDAVNRILNERTGLSKPHFKFLSVFGNADREFSDEFKAFFETTDLEWKDSYWFNNRFVTLAYYALIDIDNTHPEIHELFEDFDWFDFSELPEMWMDHKSILDEARSQLKADIRQEHVVHHLLPEKFTMPELHRLYQCILEQKLDRSRFQKKMLSTGIFERLPLVDKKTPGRNPFQYRIK